MIVSDDMKLIKQAQTLLYVDSAKKIIEAHKGTQLYAELLSKLRIEIAEE